MVWMLQSPDKMDVLEFKDSDGSVFVRASGRQLGEYFDLQDVCDHFEQNLKPTVIIRAWSRIKKEDPSRVH